MVDDGLREDKETLEDLVGDYKSELVRRRDRGLEDGMRLETQECSHCLEVFVSNLVMALDYNECDNEFGYFRAAGWLRSIILFKLT